MKKQELVEEIEAFAAARASGNTLLAQRQKASLEHTLSRLLDDLPEVTQEASQPELKQLPGIP